MPPGGHLALTTWGLAEGSYLGLYAETVQAAGALPPPDLPAGPSFFAYADEAAFADLLRSVGLRDVGVRAVRMRHPAASPRKVWDGLLGGTVRNAAFIRAQAAAVQERIRDEFERRPGSTTVHGELELSVEIKITRGTNAAG